MFSGVTEIFDMIEENLPDVERPRRHLQVVTGGKETKMWSALKMLRNIVEMDF